MVNQLVFDIETTGLNPMVDRITCISILNPENERAISFYGEDESKILALFWDSFSKSSTLIGFNSDSFDTPFVLKRSLILGVKVTTAIKMIDLRKVVNGFFYSYDKYSKGTLNDWAKILGCEVKTTNGLEVVEAFVRRDWELIKSHCETDVQITKKLFSRCQEVGLL